MELTQSICSKDLLKSEVIDSTGSKVGHVSELTFTFDGSLQLSQFIIAGSVFEELLESIGVRPDKDPVFDSSLIKKIDDKKVYLNTTLDKLKTTLDDSAISDNEIPWSKLTKLEIYDKNNEKVGKAVDVDFDMDGTTMMIVGGGFIEEKLESSGIKADVDILVPGAVIDSVGDKIVLNVSKSKLDSTMDDALQSEEEQVARSAKTISRDVSKVRLFSHRPY